MNVVCARCDTLVEFPDTSPDRQEDKACPFCGWFDLFWSLLMTEYNPRLPYWMY